MDPCLDQIPLQVPDCKTVKRDAGLSFGQNVHGVGSRKKHTKGKASGQLFAYGV